MAAVAAVYLIGSLVRSRDPILVLVLTGVVVGALLGAGVGLVKYLADPYNQLPAMTFWLLGSLSAASVSDLLPLFGPVALGTAVLIALRWRMNAMSLPEEEARALGVATGPLRIAIVAAATLVTSASVATAGIIGWVGLVVPHLARALVGPGFRAAHARGGHPRRRLSAAHRYAGAHRGGGRNPARYFDCGDRHAVLHLAARRHAEELVVKLEGRDLDHRLSGPRRRARARRCAGNRRGAGAARAERRRQDHAAQDPARPAQAKAGEVCSADRPLAAYSIRERARIIAYVPQVHVGTFAFTVETVVLMGRTAHGNLFSAPERA